MMSRPQGPTGEDCTPYEVNRPIYHQAAGQDGFGGVSMQFAQDMFHDPNVLLAPFNGENQPTHQQAFYQFSGDFKTSDLQDGDFTQPRHWHPFAAPDFTGLLANTQPANPNPPVAETGDQINIPSEVKTERDADVFTNEENNPPSQYHPTPGTSSMPTGVNYYTPWNSSLWPGVSPITPQANISEAPSASSSSLSPSPPGNVFESPGFFNGGTTPSLPSGQAQSAPRSIGSSSGGCSDSEEEENLTTEDLEQFAKELKHKRITLGFTQADVGLALGNLYGKMFSQTTICRFEALQLSFKNMCKLKPLLQSWLNEAETSDNPQDMYKIERVFVDTRKRKRRTSLEGTVRTALESYFVKCPKPNTQEITHISEHLGLERDVVRVWFCNRRQKGKRLALPYEEECAEAQYYQQSLPPLPQMGGTDLPGQGYPGPVNPGGDSAAQMNDALKAACALG